MRWGLSRATPCCGGMTQGPLLSATHTTSRPLTGTTPHPLRSHAARLQHDILLRRLAGMADGPVLQAMATDRAWPGMREGGAAWVHRLLKLEQLHRVLQALEQPQVGERSIAHGWCGATA